MKNKKISYWFYLEPYTFLFKGQDSFVIYNTLNAAYIRTGHSTEIENILNQLYETHGNYCIGLSETEVKQEDFISLLKEIRVSFSGDMVSTATNPGQPFIFKPLLRIHHNPQNDQVLKDHLIGINILLFLNEITFYLGTSCPHQCVDCGSYYKQLPHCTQVKEEPINPREYISVLEQVKCCDLSMIHLVTSTLENLYAYTDFLQESAKYKFKKNIFLPYLSLTEDVEKIFLNDTFSLTVIVHYPIDPDELIRKMELLKTYPVSWNLIVTQEKELHIYEQLQIEENIPINILPYFNSSNETFFEKYVYNDLEDILAQPLKKQAIFRRQAVNECFFGKLTVFPSGNVYSSMYLSPIGNIRQMKISEIIYHEVQTSRAWLKTRDAGVCHNCANKYLCPSPSNYEWAIGKMNLCHIKIKSS